MTDTPKLPQVEPTGSDAEVLDWLTDTEQSWYEEAVSLRAWAVRGSLRWLAATRKALAEEQARRGETIIFEDALPCDLTDELFASSTVDGVRVYPVRVVLDQVINERDAARRALAEAKAEAEKGEET